jgi:hypothetical protein
MRIVKNETDAIKYLKVIDIRILQIWVRISQTVYHYIFLINVQDLKQDLNQAKIIFNLEFF